MTSNKINAKKNVLYMGARYVTNTHTQVLRISAAG